MSRHLTVAELRELMIGALRIDGWHEPEIAGYVAAMESAGWLRVNCPQWMRDSVAPYYVVTPKGGHGPRAVPIVRPKILTTAEAAASKKTERPHPAGAAAPQAPA